MRAEFQSLLLVFVAAGLLSCGGDEERTDAHTCGGGFAEETRDRYGDLEGDCQLRGYFSGVTVLLPTTSADRG